jgi:membrane protease YdiL (CAAX protease family)
MQGVAADRARGAAEDHRDAIREAEKVREAMQPATAAAARADLYGPASPFRELPRLTAAGALARQLGSYLVLAGAVAAFAWIVRSALPEARLSFTAADFALGLAGVVFYALYNAGFSVALRATARGKTLLGWMAQRNSTMFGKLPLSTMFVMAALAGPFEELIFRGWLQPVVGLWIASMLFAGLHFLPNRYKWSHPMTWGMIALYFPIGLVVGWVYAWRGNLLAPILMHSLSDSLGLLFLARAVASGARTRAVAAAHPPQGAS